MIVWQIYAHSENFASGMVEIVNYRAFTDPLLYTLRKFIIIVDASYETKNEYVHKNITPAIPKKFIKYTEVLLERY